MPVPYRQSCTIDDNGAQPDWLIDVVEMLAAYAQQNRLPAVGARLTDVIAVLREEMHGNRPLH